MNLPRLLPRLSARHLLILVLLLALLVRLAAVVYTVHARNESKPIRPWDEHHYQEVAVAFLAGEGMSTSWTPLVPAVLIAIRVVDGSEHFMAARLLWAVAGTLLCYLAFLLGRRLGGEAAGLVACLVTACNPFFIQLSALTNTCIPHVIFLCLFILAVWRFGERRASRDLILAGVVAGLGTLNREEFVLVIPVFCLYALLRHRGGVVVILKQCALLAIVTFAVLAPWLVRNAVTHDAFVFVTQGRGGFNLYLGNNPLTIQQYDDAHLATIRDFLVDPELRTEAAVRRLADAGIEVPDDLYLYQGDGDYAGPIARWIRDHPGDYARTLLYKTWRFYRFLLPGELPMAGILTGILAQVAIVILAILGVRVRWRRNGEELLFLLLLVVSFSLLYIFAHPKMIYRIISIDHVFLVLASTYVGERLSGAGIRSDPRAE